MKPSCADDARCMCRDARDVSRRMQSNVRVPPADPRLRVHALAERVFLLSRASSHAYEPYMILKDHGEESLTPGIPGEIRTP